MGSNLRTKLAIVHTHFSFGIHMPTASQPGHKRLKIQACLITSTKRPSNTPRLFLLEMQWAEKRCDIGARPSIPNTVLETPFKRHTKHATMSSPPSVHFLLCLIQDSIFRITNIDNFQNYIT